MTAGMRIDARGLLGRHEQGPGLMNSVNLQAAAARVSGMTQTLIGILGNLKLRIRAIIRPSESHMPGTHEAGELIDVTTGLVKIDALLQPYHRAHRQVSAQLLFYVLARQMWIAIRIEQALFCGQARALSVHVNCAALHHQRRAVAVSALHLQNLLRDLIIPVPRKVQSSLQTSPGVECPINAAAASLRIDDERWAAVAHPRIVAADLDDAHAARQACARILKLRRRDSDRHRLAAGDRRRDRSKGCLCRLPAQAPRAPSSGPQNPTSRMPP